MGRTARTFTITCSYHYIIVVPIPRPYTPHTFPEHCTYILIILSKKTMLLAAHDAEVVAANDTPAAQLMMPHVSDSQVPHLSPSMVDTPIKQDSTTLLPFTTYTRCRVDTLNAMGREMKSHVVGPMPPEEFLRLFLPISQIPHMTIRVSLQPSMLAYSRARSMLRMSSVLINHS
jgi:hypothetical protein